MLNRRTALTSMALLPAAIAANALSSSAQTGPGSSTLRVGVVGTDSFAEGYYAQDMGFFKSGGLSVELVPITTGAQVAAAVAGGAIDIGVSNTLELANAIAHAVPFVIIAGGGLSDAAPALVVAKSSLLKSAKDLEGKTVAVQALKDLTQIAPSAWMEQNGADFRKIRFIEIHFPEMSAALERGTVDAAVLAEPYLSAANGTTVRVLAKVFNSIAPLFLMSAWFSSRDYFAKNTDVVKRFVAVMSDTARWANEHHDLSADILAKYTKIDLATIKTMPRTSYALSPEPRFIQPLLTQLYKFHAIAKPLTVADVVATQ
jgi:NitT/TauT family transport system substrate-binding protein